jgi:hypothetical protein
MSPDLDQLIRHADPAAELRVVAPDPTLARTSLRDRPPLGRRPRRSVILPAVSLLVVAAVVAVILAASGHRSTSTPASPPPATGRVLLQTADPSGGPAWGLELVMGSGKRECLRIGRVRRGRLGTIGRFGADNGDGAFHRLTSRDRQPGQDLCAYPDGNGNVFITAITPTISASGDARASDTSSADQRTIEYGFLGPDLQSVTYTDGHGHLRTRRAGPGGSFLIVLPQTEEVCRAGTCSEVNGGAGTAIGAGPIVKLTYRNGSTCQVSSGARPTCPIEGRGATPVVTRAPIASRSDVAAPVTATPLPARFYCEPRHSRDLSGLTPCTHSTPRGDLRLPGIAGAVRNGRTVAPEEVVQISFIARLATGSRRRYEFSYRNPCGGGGGGGPANYEPVRAGQRIMVKMFFPSSCHGRYTGEVSYAPKTGRPALGQAPTTGGAVLVGNFSFTLAGH